MADKKIEELPLLTQSDFDPANDFIIVQQPGGGTFKVPASYLVASAESSSSYFDSQEIELNYTSRSGGDSSQNFSETIVFEKKNILSRESAFKLDVYIENLQNGSKLISYGRKEQIPAFGPVANQTVSKSAEESITSNGIALDSSGQKQLVIINAITSSGHATRTTYYITYDLSNLDQIVLRFNVTSWIHPQLNYRTDHIAAIKVKVRASISGDAIQ